LSRTGVPRLTDLLDAEDQGRIASLAMRRRYRDGELIHERGDVEDAIGIVISGRIKMYNPRADGSEIFSGLIHTGQTYGDAGLLHAGARLHRAVAVGETLVDHIGGEAFKRLLDNPRIVRALYMIATFRLHTTLGLLDDLRTLSPELRLARLLLRMQQAVGGDRVNFLQEELAGMVGISTVTLAKALRRLTDEGLIQPGYRHVKVCDSKALAEWSAAQEHK
jgi:CRP/FNR family cyclic AMP-dependent transcriptional regulator